MKHTLPWNVTGIPQEAREVARAAAQREGTTVGDWLTRRILAESARAASAVPVQAEPSAASLGFASEDEPRRGRDELALKLARTELEAQSAFRRIDEALRTLARRLETSERSQSEAHRAMSVAANEINAATRDQSQAFQHLTARIDRVEQNSDTVALRDAVRGLHQGLSRLADQIAKTSNESSSQIAALAGNVEMLAGTVATAREESNHFGQALEEKVAALAERVKQNEERIALSLQLEERVKETENRLKQSEERVVAPALPDESLAKIEARMNATEQRLQDWLGRHLTVIERNFQHIGARLEQGEQRAESEVSIQEALQTLGERIDAAEEKHREALSELKASLSEPPKPIEPVEVEAHEAIEAPAPFNAAVTAAFAPAAFDFPALPDALPIPADGEALTPVEAAFNAIPIEELEPEVPPAQSSAENYLAQARRAAQAAAVADSESAGLGKRRARATHNREIQHRRRLSRFMAVAAALVLLIAAAGIFITRIDNTKGDAVALASALPATKSAAIESPISQAEPVNSASATNPAAASSADAAPASDPVQAAPQRVASISSTAAAAPRGSNQLAELIAQANQGSAKAALNLGLKYADGDGIAVNDSQAATWLQKAAQAGEAVAQYRLGTLYEKGRGVGADSRQAMHWYGEAAKHGNRKAMHNLAVAYADGAGAQKNFAEAARWFKAAAELGLTDSQFNLAVLYERGLGVKASLPEAYKWYAIAAASGDTESKTRIEAIASQMQSADRDNAERAARAYRPASLNLAANDGP